MPYSEEDLVGKKDGVNRTACLSKENMTPSQMKAFELALSGTRNLFITGSAGCGKSAVAKSIYEYLQLMGRNVLRCASTGIAAINIEGGMTVHAAFGFPADSCIMDDGPEKGMRLKIGTPKLVKAADVIMIDEISMISPDLMDAVILSIRKAEEETGRPKTLIVLGDMLQLPPVIQDQRVLESFYQVKHDNWYPYMGRYWDECGFDTLFLTETLRQDDPEFIRSLEKIRKGDKSGLDYINTAYRDKPPENAVSLFAYKQKAHDQNMATLKSLEGEEYTFRTIVDYEPVANTSQLRRQIGVRIPPDLTIKPQAQILFTATDYNGSCSSRIRMSGESILKQPVKYNFVNGMTGTVISIKDDSIIVKTEKGDYLEVSPMPRPLYAHTVDSKRFVKVKVATVTQYPFILAYALTIHRAQGQTLSLVIVDPDVFAPGQLYVALSRVRSIENLILTRKIRPEDLLVDHDVLRFYERAEKLAGLSKKKGRPTKNTDGSRRSEVIWVPAALGAHVREEIRQNRIIDLVSLPKRIPGRERVRVTEEMAPRIKAQIAEWSKEVKKKNKTV